MDHCKLKTNLKFVLTYLGKNFVQICSECIFNVMLTKKLDRAVLLQLTILQLTKLDLDVDLFFEEYNG